MHYLFREFIMNSLSFSRNSYKFPIYLMNSLRFSYRLRKVTIDSLSIRRIRDESIIHWIILYQLREFNLELFSFSRIHQLGIYRLFREFTVYSWSILWINHEFITYFANSRQILYRLREFTMDLFLNWRIHYWFITYFSESL